MSTSAIYAAAMRDGKPGVIKYVTASTADPETGIRVDTETTINVRRMVKEPTTNTRLYRAQAVDQDIGETTFMMMVKEVKSILGAEPRIDQEAYVTYQSKRYEVVSTTVEEDGFIITANILNKP